MNRIYQLFSTILLTCSIAACGGGGGGGSSNGTAGTSTSAGTPNSATTPAATTPASPNVHTLQLAWSIPAARENGTPLTAAEISGYQVYYFKEGTSADNGEVVTIAGGDSSSGQIAVNGSGTYYFAIAAVDQAGLVSKLSNYVPITLN